MLGDLLHMLQSDGFDAHPSHLPQTPSARAAGLTRAALIFRQNLRRGLLKPDSTKEGHLCMDTYRCFRTLFTKPYLLANDYLSDGCSIVVVYQALKV